MQSISSSSAPFFFHECVQASLELVCAVRAQPSSIMAIFPCLRHFHEAVGVRESAIEFCSFQELPANFSAAPVACDDLSDPFAHLILLFHLSAANFAASSLDVFAGIVSSLMIGPDAPHSVHCTHIEWTGRRGRRHSPALPPQNGHGSNVIGFLHSTVFFSFHQLHRLSRRQISYWTSVTCANAQELEQSFVSRYAVISAI